MSDIENIKDRVISSRTVFVAEDGKGNEIIIATGEILSLITTIESLEARIEIKDQALEGARNMFNQYVEKRNIEVLIWKDAATFANKHKLSTTSLQKELAEKNTLIESQKEEIENKRDLILTSNKMYTEISLRESDLNDEIDRLKAITELAVKNLTEIISITTMPEIDAFDIGEIKRIANLTIQKLGVTI